MNSCKINNKYFHVCVGYTLEIKITEQSLALRLLITCDILCSLIQQKNFLKAELTVSLLDKERRKRNEIRSFFFMLIDQHKG